MTRGPSSTVVHAHPEGDGTRIDVRLLVATAAGTFRPGPVAEATTEGELVRPGDVVAFIDGPGRSEPVVSFCTGFLLRLLAEPGERVRPGQRLAWLHPVDVPRPAAGDAA